MNHLAYNSGILSVALITVSVDQPIADEIAECVIRMPWSVHRSDCEGYISGTKRPPFTQTVKSAQACIALIDFDKDIDGAIEAAAYIQSLFAGNAAIVALSASQDPEILLR